MILVLDPVTTAWWWQSLIILVLSWRFMKIEDWSRYINPAELDVSKNQWEVININLTISLSTMKASSNQLRPGSKNMNSPLSTRLSFLGSKVHLLLCRVEQEVLNVFADRPAQRISALENGECWIYGGIFPETFSRRGEKFHHECHG